MFAGIRDFVHKKPSDTSRKEKKPVSGADSRAHPESLPEKPGEITLAERRAPLDLRRIALIALGLALFTGVFLSPSWPDATDPVGDVFALSREGKAAIGLFLLAAVWWVFEVVPIGVTSIAIAVFQAMFLIRDPRVAFTDFFDPSVWFIFGSLIIGKVFSKTGLTQRLAYRMLVVVGERTALILLGVFLMTSAMTLVMAHTAVAAAMYPLLRAIYTMYSHSTTPTRFGKGLFIGMAFVAGAGSIITLLGAARGAVGIAFFKDIVGREITFFEYSYYMFPVGVAMTVLLWGYMLLVYRPEKAHIPGLRERAHALYSRLGPMKRGEWTAVVLVAGVIVFLSLRSFVPALAPFNKSAIILTTTILFFLFRILNLKDLEEIPWNIILLFGGAMSIGFCLWQTGAARWLAVQFIMLLENANWFIFVLGIAAFVLLMTNLIMNVAAIAISLPVALVIAQYVHVAPEVVFWASLAVAGMPFLFLVGAAPNAIAYESGQFKSGEFFKVGAPASVLLMAVLAVFIAFIWPMMGMPVLLPQ
ncbi:MAG: Sodium-dependent dicarboxylate transporter SdcS [Calditrichaeota bacterium]|nr:Sodium-dependent dicarboxylate transporter SdcS [Calditrichota bacterium]